MSTLGEKAYTDQDNPTVYNRIVDMYHAGTDKESQGRIASGIVDPNCSLRCVVATIAFGLGINLPDVEEVVHWGPAADIMSYWQEVGRCARDGRQGKGTLFIFPRSTDKRLVDANLKKLIDDVQKCGECLRRGILDHLFVPEMSRESLKLALENPYCCCSCNK